MNPYDVEEFHSEKYTESLKAERIIHEHLHKYRLMRKDGTLKEWFRIPKPNRPDIFKAFNEARRIIDSDEPYVLSETEGDEPDSDDDDSDFVPNDEPDSEDNDSSESESDMDTDKDK
jgi:hypothetical protein